MFWSLHACKITIYSNFYMYDIHLIIYSYQVLVSFFRKIVYTIGFM